MKGRKLYEIHLPEPEWSIRQFKMSRNNANRLPWVVLQTSGTSEVGIFQSLVNGSSPMLTHEWIILS